MKQVSRSALVPFSNVQMFDVVNDVAAYPRFLPWCSGSVILEQSDELMVATLSIAKAGLATKFTTRNILRRGSSIELTLVDGPFKTLQGSWSFSALGDAGCKTQMSLRFDVASKMLDFTLARVFEQAADTMVDAFCQRAEQIYA